MRHKRFVRSSWLVLALVLAGFAGGCGSGEGPATGSAVKGVPEVVNGVSQIDDTAIRTGKMEMYASKGAKAKSKGGAVGPYTVAQGRPR